MYRVTWIIDLDEEGTPSEIARKALEIQRDPESIATIFTIQPWIENRGPVPGGEVCIVDLLREPDPEPDAAGLRS